MFFQKVSKQWLKNHKFKRIMTSPSRNEQHSETLHGQNLCNMLRNYRQQYRHLRADQRKELGHFFNTASNVLDTIGSMTENAILRSVKYSDDDADDNSGMEGRQ